MAKMMINHGILGGPSDKLRQAHISDPENGVEDILSMCVVSRPQMGYKSC